jgi:hypothetical protein
MRKEDLDKFGKVAAMMGSAHDGEVLAAARLATKILRDNNMTWHDLAVRALVPQAAPRRDPFEAHIHPQAQRNAQRPTRHRIWNGIDASRFLSAIDRHKARLNAWECAALASLISQAKTSGGMTERQWEMALGWGERVRVYSA